MHASTKMCGERSRFSFPLLFSFFPPQLSIAVFARCLVSNNAFRLIICVSFTARKYIQLQLFKFSLLQYGCPLAFCSVCHFSQDPAPTAPGTNLPLVWITTEKTCHHSCMFPFPFRRFFRPFNTYFATTQQPKMGNNCVKQTNRRT